MVRLTTCDCGPDFLIRMNRSWWMRLIPERRFYYCARCDTEMFLSRSHVGSIGAEPSRPALSPAASIAHDTGLLR